MENGAGTTIGGGARSEELLAFSLGSNTIWRLRHTDEGCSDSQKLCKCCQTLSSVIQLQHVKSDA